MNDALTFHCPHCGADNSASDGARTCHACKQPFAAAPVPPSPPSPPSPSVVNGVADTSAAALPRGTEIGGYRIERELGRGGSGVVYLAVQTSRARTVALKVLPRQLAADAEFRWRFERSAPALGGLKHPHIVEHLDRGVAGDCVYLVMEYVDGVSLRCLQLDGKLAPEQALQIVAQLCAALDHAHDQGVVHLNIKPENILLDADGQVKVSDFGLARIIHGETSAQSQLHSPLPLSPSEYRAPEQRESGRSVDQRADIFSVGVIFYELLTGVLPLGRFPEPSKKVKLDTRLDDVILKSLEMEPDRRYQRAQQFLTDVETIASTYGTRTRGRFPAAPGGSAPPGACFDVKGGRRIEIGPTGVKVYEPPPAPAASPDAPMAVPNAGSGSREYQLLVAIALVLALTPPLMIFLLIMFLYY